MSSTEGVTGLRSGRRIVSYNGFTWQWLLRCFTADRSRQRCHKSGDVHNSVLGGVFAGYRLWRGYCTDVREAGDNG
jgi:hypothetical protein